ncbi:hypothetical protein ZIOFF_024195 [Zingiber officinale]|uniref:Integrase catalytic domain-containing protein n=1 Tax=Zingiber officinale TaxID=94328 RepID=A0A8J5LIY0_ZINOF|nr:hypothetical protein ZIOFF_024195 [Zingiber officinale]
MTLASTLLSDIQTAQDQDPEIRKIKQGLAESESGEFRVSDSGVLYFGDRLCFPDQEELRRKILDEAHKTPYAMHSDSTKMYQDLKRRLWWPGMKRDIARYIPEWKWEDISMDFIVGLPKTTNGFDAIWVIVNRLTKSAHFLAIRISYSMEQLAQLYLKEIVRLHGVPRTIISDRDSRFTSHFWKCVQSALGTRLKFSTTFHPRTDGQMERVNHVLEGMLRACALDFKGNMWNHTLSPEELASHMQIYMGLRSNGWAPIVYTTPCLDSSFGFLKVRNTPRTEANRFKWFFRAQKHVESIQFRFYSLVGRYRKSSYALMEVRFVFKKKSSLFMIMPLYKLSMWGNLVLLTGNMLQSNARQDNFTFPFVLKACAQLAAVAEGMQIHGHVAKLGFERDLYAQNSLLNFYGKCGRIELARKLFDEMGRRRNTWTYSVVISGLAMHSEGHKALQVFEEMLSAGHVPDEAIYVGVLSACSHAALLDEALLYLDRMKFEHGIPPNPQHYGCIVDLMARAGKLREAHELIHSASIAHAESAWRCLLSACKIHGDLNLAECAVRKLKDLGACNTGDYIIASSMYAKAQKWSEAALCRKEMADFGLLQVPGQSKVEVKGKLHSFVSHDRSHPESDEIYEMLHQVEWQLRAEGYVPDTSEVVMDLNEEEKRRAVAAHSQKLAIAFALAKTGKRRAIRIVTNLRMSKDCHTYSAFVSRIFEREINIRDRNRFHRFRRGLCACGGRW